MHIGDPEDRRELAKNIQEAIHNHQCWLSFWIAEKSFNGTVREATKIAKLQNLLKALDDVSDFFESPTLPVGEVDAKLAATTRIANTIAGIQRTQRKVAKSDE